MLNPMYTHTYIYIGANTTFAGNSGQSNVTEAAAFALLETLPKAITCLCHEHSLILTNCEERESDKYICDVCGHEDMQGFCYRCKECDDYSCHVLCVLKMSTQHSAANAETGGTGTTSEAPVPSMAWVAKDCLDLAQEPLAFWDDCWLQSAIAGNGLGMLHPISSLPPIGQKTHVFLQECFGVSVELRDDSHHKPHEIFICTDCACPFPMLVKNIKKGVPLWNACLSCIEIRIQDYFGGDKDEVIKGKCKHEFTFTSGEKRHQAMHGFDIRPTRCGPCRSQKGSNANASCSNSSVVALCTHFQKSGRCIHGDKCRFQHEVGGYGGVNRNKRADGGGGGKGGKGGRGKGRGGGGKGVGNSGKGGGSGKGGAAADAEAEEWQPVKRKGPGRNKQYRN
jgi:uncharacterized membrane protein YgcG